MPHTAPTGPMASKTPTVARTPSQAASQRLPAPSLFIGPPSRNASNTSVAPGSSSSAGAPPTGAPPTNPRAIAPSLSRQISQRGALRGGGGGLADTDSTPLTPVLSRKDGGGQAPGADHQQTDALWAEMQNTLEEVELSATHGTHVFGPGHSGALDALRTAQIALAQAWARSEAEEEEEEEDRGEVTAAKVLAEVGVGRPRSGTDASAKSERLERDTEQDILLARRRREANDRYFQRVNAGVLDVVAKLEEVARAMKGVEVESKEMWGDTGESGGETGSFGSK